MAKSSAQFYKQLNTSGYYDVFFANGQHATLDDLKNAGLTAADITKSTIPDKTPAQKPAPWSPTQTAGQARRNLTSNASSTGRDLGVQKYNTQGQPIDSSGNVINQNPQTQINQYNAQGQLVNQQGQVVNQTPQLASQSGPYRVPTGSTDSNGNTIYDVFDAQGNYIKDPNDPRLRGLQIENLPLGQAPSGFQSSFLPTQQDQAQQQDQSNAPGITNIDTSKLTPAEAQVIGIVQGYMNEVLARGSNINPNIQITPDQAAQFLQQAQNEISPYYANQLKAASDAFSQSLGYSAQQVNEQENQIAQQYQQNLKDLGNQAASQGFAQSGIRNLAENQLAQNANQQALDAFRNASYNAGQSAGTFAQTYGTANLPITPSLQYNTFSAGNPTPTGSSPSPFYTLSPNVYNGLTGSQEYQQQADISNRSNQLQANYISQQQNQQLRNLTL